MHRAQTFDKCDKKNQLLLEQVQCIAIVSPMHSYSQMDKCINGQLVVYLEPKMAMAILATSLINQKWSGRWSTLNISEIKVKELDEMLLNLEFVGCKIQLECKCYFSTKTHFLMSYYSNGYSHFTFSIGLALIHILKYVRLEKNQKRKPRSIPIQTKPILSLRVHV